MNLTGKTQATAEGFTLSSHRMAGDQEDSEFVLTFKCPACGQVIQFIYGSGVNIQHVVRCEFCNALFALSFRLVLEFVGGVSA